MRKIICLLFFLFAFYTRLVSSWCLRTIFAGADSIQSVDFSPDGEYILTGEKSGRVMMWKRDTLQILKTYNFPYTLWQAVFSKNQVHIAIAGENDNIHVINVSNFNVFHIINTNHGKVYDIDFRYDSERIITCGDDEKTRMWNTSNAVKMDQVPNEHKSYTCEYGDNEWFAVAGDFFIQSYENNTNWNNPTGNANKIYKLHNHALSRFLCVRVKPNSDYLIAVGTGGDFVEAVLNSSSTDSTISGAAGGLYSCAYSRDSTYFAAAGDNGNIYMYNATNRANTLESILRPNSPSIMKSAQFSYDSNYFLAGNEDGTVYFYDRFCNGCPVGSYPNKTVCRKCVQTLVGCSICLNSSVCRSCMSGFYISSSACKSCDTIQGCATCNSSSNCSTCMSGFYKSGLTCIRCLTTQYGCQQCTGPTTCLECDKNSYLNGSTCIACTTLTQCVYCNSSSYCLECRVGYYEDNGVCTVCESVANPYCLICQTAMNCSRCVSGYRVNSSRLCEKCLPQCLFCNDTNHCFDCIEQMYVTTTFTCAFCTPPCYSCNSSSYCHTCIASYYLSSAGTCSNCPGGCLACNSSTRCQACDVGFYLDTGTWLCVKCSGVGANCRECNASLCLACQVDYLLVSGACYGCSQLMSNCQICDNATICQLCMTGYWPTGLTGNLSCSLCQPGCTACKSSTACTSCKQGYYISSQDCLLCSNNCLTCKSSSASSCTACIEGYYLSSTTMGSCLNCSVIPKCAACLNASYCVGCAVGYFLSAPTTCTLCTAPCTSCNTSLTDCLTCGLGFYLYTTGTGTGACSPCNPQCSQCSTSASACLNCVEGYYQNSTTLSCINCSITLTGCSVCDNASTCVLCQSGYYPFGGACRACALSIPKCLRCNTLGTTCSLCDYGFALSPTNSSCLSCQSSLTNCQHCTSSSSCQTCKPMFYASSGSCLACPTGCITCSNGSACQVCMYTYVMLASRLCQLCQDALVGCRVCTGVTVCVDCVVGYYINVSTCYACRTAMEGCEACSDGTHCTQCNVFYQLQTNSTCILCSSIYPACQLCSNTTVGCLQCQIGYYLSPAGQCQPCSPSTSLGCLKCSSNTTCTQCLAGYYLNATSALCSACENAFFGCIFCSASACLQCESGFYLNAGACTACPKEGCQVCLWNDPNKCVGCNSRYYLVADSCVLCSQAMPQCLQCQNSSACTECASGFYLSPTYQCSLCSTLHPGCSLCSPSGCLDCMSNFFLNSSDLQCHNCTDYLPGCAFCLTDSLCISCQNGYYMVNSTCLYCATMSGCLYCINETKCTYCEESYYLAANDSLCYLCKDVLPGCYACGSNTTCIGCYGNYQLLGGECVEIKGEVTRKYPQIGIKSVYVNDSCLKHTLFARDFQFTMIEQDWPNVSSLTLISKNYTEYPLTILKVQWGTTGMEIYFYTNNPIADQLSQSIKNMPFVKTARRMLQDATTTDLGFNLKLMLKEQATHDIMPKLSHLGDLYLDYPYSDAAFYQSYLRSRPYYYFLFGLVITILLLILYSIKLCCVLPGTKDRGSIIPHIFAVKCGALALYPTYAQFVNFCYGFMMADLPWFNEYFGEKFGNANDVLPESYAMYYVNLSMVSTYFMALLIIACVWFCVGLASYICETLKPRLQIYKSLLYNFFSFGSTMAGCLCLQGVILNPLDSLNANTVFYIVGIVIYLGIFVQIVYGWSVSKNQALLKLKAKEGDQIGTAGHIGKLRMFCKATLLALMHYGPLYVISAIFCMEIGVISLEYLLTNKEKVNPKLEVVEHILANLTLLLLILVPDALVGIVIALILISLIMILEVFRLYKEINEQSELQKFGIANAKNDSRQDRLQMKSNSTQMNMKMNEEIKNQDSLVNLVQSSVQSQSQVEGLSSPVVFRNRNRRAKEKLQFSIQELEQH